MNQTQQLLNYYRAYHNSVIKADEHVMKIEISRYCLASVFAVLFC